MINKCHKMIVLKKIHLDLMVYLLNLKQVQKSCKITNLKVVQEDQMNTNLEEVQESEILIKKREEESDPPSSQ